MLSAGTAPRAVAAVDAVPPLDADADLGSGALLRVAAVPVQSWLAGGDPALFAELDEIAEQSRQQAEAAQQVAAAIGERLVPHPELEAGGRAAALRVRRALHRGVVAADTKALAKLAATILPCDRLAGQLSDLAEDAAALAARRTALDERIIAEEHRLAELPWQLLHEQVAGRHAVQAGDLAMYADIAARLAAGEPWHTKRMRQRGDYLWRMLTRAATRATPRGWLAHVAGLEVGSGWTGSGPLRLLDLAAVEVAENLGHSKAAAGDCSPDGLPQRLAVTPLHQWEAQHLLVWTLSGQSHNRLGHVRLRRSPVLEAVLERLSAGPRVSTALLDELAGPSHERRAALSGLLAHLVRLGVLQACVAPRRQSSGWRATRDVPAAVRAADDFVDVYRRAATPLDRSYVQRLSGLVELALRVGALADGGAPASPAPVPPGLETRPRPLLDIAAECLAAGTSVQRGIAHHHDWPVAADPDSGYGRLARWLRPRLDGPDPIDLDEAILDGFGAPPADRHWPMDCVVRPLSGADGIIGVLDQVTAAGNLDARFLPALSFLDEKVPQVVAYRRFLDELGAQTPFVEVLFPPLSERAANAVRRPAYTSLWTGDPDRAGYLAPEQAQYLPLSRITLRRDGGQVIAEADGRPIWPIMHTTRAAPAPWDTIADLLLLASPQPERTYWRTMVFTLTGWPGRNLLPRITVGGGLVLSPAQWRLRPDELWHRDDPLPDKVAALAALRHRRGLPRLVTIVADPHDDPVALDLCSLTCVKVLDRWLQRGVTGLLLREFPADRVAVCDDASGGAHVAELLLRLPSGVGPAEAARLAARHRLHGRPAGSAATSGETSLSTRE